MYTILKISSVKIFLEKIRFLPTISLYYFFKIFSMGIIFSTRWGNQNESTQNNESSKTIFTNKQAPDAVWPYNKSLRAWNLLFLSGQIGLDPKTMQLISWGVEAETRQACHNIEAVLSESWLGFKDVIKTTVFVKNIADFETVNEIYKNYFIVKPARSMVEVSALPKWALIEIEVIAEYK